MTQFDNNLTLGQHLRQERERRGITIEQVASATKIGVKQLHALESDQYAELPAKPFVRGFVTSYSRFIGLDHKEVLTHFGTFIDGKVHERPNRESGHSGYAFEKREGGEQSRMVLGIVMGSFLVLGGVALVVLKPALHKSKHSHLDKLRAVHAGSASGVPVSDASPVVGPPFLASVVAAVPSPTVSAAPVSETKSPEAVAAALPSPTPSSSPSTVVASASPTPTETPADPLNSGIGLKPNEIKERTVVKAVNSVWVRYQSDDRPVMQFPLRAGKVLVIRARQSMVLQIADPSSVQMSHNGSGYRPAGSFNPVDRQNDATFFFPAQVAEKIQEPFPGQKPISSREILDSSTH